MALLETHNTIYILVYIMCTTKLKMIVEIMNTVKYIIIYVYDCYTNIIILYLVSTTMNSTLKRRVTIKCGVCLKLKVVQNNILRIYYHTIITINDNGTCKQVGRFKTI